MDLIGSSERLSLDAEAIVDQARDKQRLKGLRGRSERLDGPVSRYTRISAQAGVLRTAGIRVGAVASAAALRHRGEEVLAAFAADPDSIIEPAGDLRYAFWEQLGVVAGEIESALRAAWQDHVAQRVVHIDADLVDELPTVDANDKRRVADLQRAVNDLRAEAPETTEALSRLDPLATRSRDLAAALNLEGLHPEVRAFVSAVGRNNATLDLVTPAVIAWLREHDMGSKFWVQFGRA